jgi:serine/threonine protein kinase
MISLRHYNTQDIFNKILPEIIYLFSFKHQNIVKYFEHFATNDFLYLVTEYCEVGMSSTSVFFKNKII